MTAFYTTPSSRLPLTFCAQSTSAGLNFSRPASFKNFFYTLFSTWTLFLLLFYLTHDELQTMLRTTVMVGSGNLHQPFFFFLYFVRFFCGRWFWTACGGSLASRCDDTFDWRSEAKGMISVTKYFDRHFFFTRRVLLAMHKSAFQLFFEEPRWYWYLWLTGQTSFFDSSVGFIH